ncbi:cyanophycinase [Pontibacter sp. JH31]|uniref:Cyanophycinase n=1 Tax=Pontibacter aquaedesilientis TaxID=2766980 RepID=A0ABR7XFX7_9BACT|nr:cyanophycinase [Pontibacter aquaedesilientis]MBD1396841.1 cyanophycinase [Pontibacter aquaedesilientis]
MTPKGKIVAIGGNEDKGSFPPHTDADKEQQILFFEQGILKRIHDELYGIGTRIEVVTTATSIPDELYQVYLHGFMLLGCDNVGHLKIQSREQADSNNTLQRLQKADAVIFTGGDQLRIAAAFNDTEALKLIRNRYLSEVKFLVAGTSAGAMALCKTMIEGSTEIKPLVKGIVFMGHGLGLLHNVIIDTHFVNRRRIPRMIEAIAMQPQLVGVGLGEDTGVLISKGNEIETIGSGLVVILDGRKLQENNFNQLQAGEPLCLEHLIMHVLPRGRRYLIDQGAIHS